MIFSQKRVLKIRFRDNNSTYAMSVKNWYAENLIRTYSSSICTLFLCALSFKITMKWAHKFLNLFLMIFKIELPITTFTLLIVYYTNFYSSLFYSCGVQFMHVFSYCIFVSFSNSLFPIFTYQKSSQILRGSLWRPIANKRCIKRKNLMSIILFRIFFKTP